MSPTDIENVKTVVNLFMPVITIVAFFIMMLLPIVAKSKSFTMRILAVIILWVLFMKYYMWANSILIIIDEVFTKENSPINFISILNWEMSAFMLVSIIILMGENNLKNVGNFIKKIFLGIWWILTEFYKGNFTNEINDKANNKNDNGNGEKKNDD